MIKPHPEDVAALGRVIARAETNSAIKRIRQTLKRLPPLSADQRAVIERECPEPRELPPDLPYRPSPPIVPEYLRAFNEQTERLAKAVWMLDKQPEQLSLFQ